MPPQLSLRGVNAHYARAHILFDLDLDVAQGEIMGLLRRNGAGKSTTMKTVIGMVRASAGQIAFAGARIRYTGTIADLAADAAVQQEYLSV